MLATLATDRTNSVRGAGGSLPVALTSGYHLAFTVGALLAVSAIAVTAALLRVQPQTVTAMARAAELDALEGEPLDEAA